MKTKLLLILFTCAFFVLSCGNKKDELASESEHEVLPPDVAEMNDSQIKQAGIEMGSVEYKMMSSVIKSNGQVSVSPQNLVSISAMMGGYIRNITLVQGSPVARGQVIAVIENPEFVELQQNYLESASKLEYAESEYNRQKSLYKENVSSAKSYEQSLAEYKTLQSSVAALEMKLRMIGIDAKTLTVEKISSSVCVYSPISGYVKTVSANVGKFVNPTDVIFEIVNTQSLTLELTLFEKDLGRVNIGQKISFATPSRPDEKMNAEIIQIGKSLNSNKTVSLYCKVETGYKNLIPGMYVNAAIETESDSVTALPAESVVSFEDKDYIFVYSERKKEGDKFVTLYKAVQITKGATNNGFVEVVLPDGFDVDKNRIVIKGAYNLLSAMKNAGDMAC